MYCTIQTGNINVDLAALKQRFYHVINQAREKPIIKEVKWLESILTSQLNPKIFYYQNMT